MLKINKRSLDRIMKVDAAPVVKREADRIAASASGLAGQVNGRGITVIRDDGQTPERARSAIIFTHPTPSGRAAARKAAEAAFRLSGGG